MEGGWLAKAEPEENSGFYASIGDTCRTANRSHTKTSTRIAKQYAAMRKLARKIMAVIIFTVAPFALSACGGPESVFVLGAGLANFIHTDRVPTDYIAEYASGQECNLLKSIEDGGPLCRNSFNPTVVEPPLYCYRTLGEPSCYVSPDPYKTGAQTIK